MVLNKEEGEATLKYKQLLVFCLFIGFIATFFGMYHFWEKGIFKGNI